MTPPPKSKGYPMKMQAIRTHPYNLPLFLCPLRTGVLLELISEQKSRSFAEVAPLPRWSQETLEECLEQLSDLQSSLLDIEWTKETCLDQLSKLSLLPALSFGLESALLALLDPLPAPYTVQTSALFLGTAEQILAQAETALKEGFLFAKLKVAHLSFSQASSLIHTLKDCFRLRVDVNRAWKTADALSFFSQFPLDAFDYVEEPFQNPQDLPLFTHPLAVDESFPADLSLDALATCPTLKALIYKPTIQGGLLHCLPLYQWTKQKNLSLIISSSFESDVGLSHIAAIAKRLGVNSPLGMGTYRFFQKRISPHLLQGDGPNVQIDPTFAGENCPISSECCPVFNL